MMSFSGTTDTKMTEQISIIISPVAIVYVCKIDIYRTYGNISHTLHASRLVIDCPPTLHEEFFQNPDTKMIKHIFLIISAPGVVYVPSWNLMRT